jgi:RNA polymerase sigma factor (sigma-70 family)
VVSFELPSDYNDDLKQEARLSILRAARRYEGAPEQLMRTVLGHSISKAAARESRRNRREVEIDSSRDVADTHQSRFLVTEYSLVKRVTEALTELPAQLKRIFELLYQEGLTQREAAIRMKVSQPRVAKLHTQLRDELKERLRSAV